MIKITICVGSSCSVRGSDRLAARLEELISEHGLEGQVDLVGSFCMGECSRGVTVAVDGDIITQVDADNADSFFAEHVLARDSGKSTP